MRGWACNALTREGFAGKRQADRSCREAKKDKFHTCGGPRRRPCLGEGRGRRIYIYIRIYVIFYVFMMVASFSMSANKPTCSKSAPSKEFRCQRKSQGQLWSTSKPFRASLVGKNKAQIFLRIMPSWTILHLDASKARVGAHFRQSPNWSSW